MSECRIAIVKKALRELAALPIEIQDRVIKTIEKRNGQRKHWILQPREFLNIGLSSNICSAITEQQGLSKSSRRVCMKVKRKM